MVKIIKLTTGEEIIGKVTESLDGSYTIKNPVTVGVIDRNGELGFVGYPRFAADLADGLNVSKNFIMFAVAIDPKLEAEYNAMFSNLIVPPKKGLTLST